MKFLTPLFFIGATLGNALSYVLTLPTAVLAGADRFITNNRRDFPRSIEEISVVHPDELPG